MKKRILGVVAIAAIAMVSLASCCGNSANCKSDKKSDSCCTETKTKAATTDVKQVDELLAAAESMVGKEVAVEGICTHLCKHGGSKMFLMGDDNTLRVESCELKSFPHSCVNSIVRVKGVVAEERIDEGSLQKWEAQLKNQVADNHGDGENGCATENAARKEVGNTPEARIADYRRRIAERKKQSGKEYLSFYHINAISYEVQ